MIDSVLFHVFGDDNQGYGAGLGNVLRPGRPLFLLCFSDEEPGTQGLAVIRRQGVCGPASEPEVESEPQGLSWWRRWL